MGIGGIGRASDNGRGRDEDGLVAASSQADGEEAPAESLWSRFEPSASGNKKPTKTIS